MAASHPTEPIPTGTANGRYGAGHNPPSLSSDLSARHPWSWKPSRFSVRRLNTRPALSFRARPQCAVEQPGDRASREEREHGAEPNGNRDDRYGPIWQTVHGAMSPVVLTKPSFSRLGYWIVDGRSASPRSDREGLRRRLPRTVPLDGASRSGSPPSAHLPTGMVSPGWRLTRLRTRRFATESLPDHPREPIDEHRGEPNGHHREPRKGPR